MHRGTYRYTVKHNVDIIPLRLGTFMCIFTTGHCDFK